MKLSIICFLQNCPPNPPVEPREPAHLAVLGSCREVQTRFVSFVFRIRSGWPGAWGWASWVGAGCDEQQGLTIFYREWHAQMEHTFIGKMLASLGMVPLNQQHINTLHMTNWGLSISQIFKILYIHFILVRGEIFGSQMELKHRKYAKRPPACWDLKDGAALNGTQSSTHRWATKATYLELCNLLWSRCKFQSV